jgi:serine/threonine protein kinase
VLAFEEDSRISVKVADFGFATCFQSENDLILMPESEPWNAPERHNRHFRPEQSRQMDTYSFGLLCFWLIFKAGSSVDLPLPPVTTLETGQFVSFERNQPEKNLLQLWRRDKKLIEWACWLVREDSRFDSRIKDNLLHFFVSTMACNPQSRCIEFEQLLDLLVPDR